tara:strand:+ start:557 stop:823 length:267 start_codon:yes stop_codon:yes gene_type:complete
MGKRRSTKDSYKSMGMFKNVSKRWTKLVKRDRDPAERTTNQWKAFCEGKNVILTIKNPNKEEKNKKFIKVKANMIWKNPNYKPKKISE